MKMFCNTSLVCTRTVNQRGLTPSSRWILLQTAKLLQCLIFLEHGVCDISLEIVKWTNQWIAQVGEQLRKGTK